MIKVGKLYRDFDIRQEDITAESRTVNLSFSSEEPIERFFGLEILDHQPKSVDLRRLKRGGALLIDHDTTNQVGVIEEVSIDGLKGRAVVRFGKSTKAEEIFQDVLDGIRKNISVGYRIKEMKLEKQEKDVDTYRITRWEPLEVSLVSVPSDITVGVGRSQETDLMEVIVQRDEEIKDTEVRMEITEIKDLDKAKQEERMRGLEIMALGDKHGCLELSRKAVEDSVSIDDFRATILEKVYKAKPIETRDQDPMIGMSDKEIRSYSLVKAIRQIADLKPLDGIEKEASDATGKIAGRSAKGFFLPQDVMKRALNVTDATKGGFTVGTELLAGEMIELLRNKTLVAQLGAKQLTGLVGNIAIPRVSGGATAYWLPETGEVTATDQAFGQLGLTPHKLIGDTAYSKELLMQSSIDIESFIREDLMRVLALAKDLAAINGTGSDGQPLGIMQTTGVQTVTFGAAPTWAKVVDFETLVATANADIGAMAYLTTPGVRGKWKTTVKVASNAIFLWEGANIGGQVNGYRGEATNQVPDNKVIFGNFADLILADWAGIDVVVDPYSLKKKGQIEITITLWADSAIRNPVSFVVSTDAGNQ